MSSMSYVHVETLKRGSRHGLGLYCIRTTMSISVAPDFFSGFPQLGAKAGLPILLQ